MAALSGAKKITKLDGSEFLRKVPIAANGIVFHGAMVAKTSGYAGAATTGADKVLGLANLSVWDDQTATGQASIAGRTTGNKVDNTGGADGARHIVVEVGVFKMGNKAGDLVDETMIGDLCYVENDQTVRATAAGSIAAGTVYGLDDDGGVWVQIPAGAYGRA